MPLPELEPSPKVSPHSALLFPWSHHPSPIDVGESQCSTISAVTSSSSTQAAEGSMQAKEEYVPQR